MVFTCTKIAHFDKLTITMLSINRLSSALAWTTATPTRRIVLGIATISAIAFAIFYAIREIRKPLPPFQLNDEEKATFITLFSKKSFDELDAIPLISKNNNPPLVKGVAHNGQPFFRIEAFLDHPNHVKYIVLERNPNGTWFQKKSNVQDQTPIYFVTPFTNEQGEWTKDNTSVSNTFNTLYALINRGRSYDINSILWQFSAPVAPPPSNPALPSSAIAPQTQT